MEMIQFTPEEAEFVAKIQTNYADDAPKLVLADWLEERGDPKGPYLRSWVKYRRCQANFEDIQRLSSYSQIQSSAWAFLLGIPQTEYLIRQSLDVRILDQITQRFRPGYWLSSGGFPSDNPTLGMTKRGGFPDLPDWQRWPIYDQAPMLFLLQINLEEMIQLTGDPCGGYLPQKGVLSFFASYQQSTEPNRSVPVTVCYFPRVSDLTPRPCPRQIAPEFLQSWQYPMYPFSDVFIPPSFFFEPAIRVYLDQLVDSGISNRRFDRTFQDCRLLGNPVNRYDCTPMQNYQLLLSGIFRIGPRADSLPLEFWILPEDLNQLRFDRIFGLIPQDIVLD